MSATKWPFSVVHQVPDEPCAGRRAARPRLVRRTTEEVVGLVLATVFLACRRQGFLVGSTDPDLSVMPFDARECLP